MTLSMMKMLIGRRLLFCSQDRRMVRRGLPNDCATAARVYNCATGLDHGDFGLARRSSLVAGKAVGEAPSATLVVATTNVDVASVHHESRCVCLSI